jgi:peptide chain release factor 3
VKQLVEQAPSAFAEDRDGAPVFMARSRWDLERTQKDWPALAFTATREEV